MSVVGPTPQKWIPWPSVLTSKLQHKRLKSLTGTPLIIKFYIDPLNLQTLSFMF